MVLFTYMCRIASNEKYTKTRRTLILRGLLIALALVSERANSSAPQEIAFEPIKATIKLFYFNSETIYIYLFFYLLLTLFVRVALRKKKEGAVRIKALYENTKNSPSTQDYKFFFN
jgi:hypothetical protein